MTTGEKIQHHRKKLKLSQDELGQKLFVSRQTVSQWETDQTLPTLDNLLRLKELFGVSVDELLSPDEATNQSQATVNGNNCADESYSFTYTNAEIAEVYRKLSASAFIIGIAGILFFITLIVVYALAQDNNIALGSCIGMGFFFVLYLISVSRLLYRNVKAAQKNMQGHVYRYDVYDTFIILNKLKDGESVMFQKIEFVEIEKVTNLKDWFIVQYYSQMFIIKKQPLGQDKRLYFMLNSRTPNHKKTSNGGAKWHFFSMLLVVLSIASLVAAMACMAILSEINKMDVENLWVFFLFLPIPVASLIYGCIGLHRGKKVKKNVIVGIIMAFLLCVYGSFSFIFPVDHSDIHVKDAENITGVQLPEPFLIKNRDGANITFPDSFRGKIYYESHLYFEESAVENFERELTSDNRWLTALPNELVGISMASIKTMPITYDYCLIYNIDSDSFNSLPKYSGTYHFINMYYQIKSNQMTIIEYDIEYYTL